ncbi:hypothetical protein LXL04_023668 [Taraxacum kok-saghyz]
MCFLVLRRPPPPPATVALVAVDAIFPAAISHHSLGGSGWWCIAGILRRPSVHVAVADRPCSFHIIILETHGNGFKHALGTFNFMLINRFQKTCLTVFDNLMKVMKVSIEKALVEAAFISDISNNPFKTVKEVVGGFVAWPKDQVIFIDDGEKITPPHTITNVADMKAPRAQKRTTNIAPNSLRKMARPNTKTQKSLNL